MVILPSKANQSHSALLPCKSVGAQESSVSAFHRVGATTEKAFPSAAAKGPKTMTKRSKEGGNREAVL